MLHHTCHRQCGTSIVEGRVSEDHTAVRASVINGDMSQSQTANKRASGLPGSRRGQSTKWPLVLQPAEDGTRHQLGGGNRQSTVKDGWIALYYYSVSRHDRQTQATS